LLLVTSLTVTGLVAGSPKPPAKPADIDISVAPGSVKPGGTAEVTLMLDPIEGVKINRYPKIKLQVPGQDGLVLQSEAAVGNDAPPPPGKSKANYFDVLDPVVLSLKLDESAEKGEHEIDAKLTYFVCVPASGFCAPKRVAVKIPVDVK